MLKHWVLSLNLILCKCFFTLLFYFQTKNSHADDCRNFLLDFANSDPTQDYCGPNSELFKGLVQVIKKQPTKTDIVAGSTVDRAVNCTFAVLVYLTPQLFGKLQTYGNYQKHYFLISLRMNSSTCRIDWLGLQCWTLVCRYPHDHEYVQVIGEAQKYWMRNDVYFLFLRACHVQHFSLIKFFTFRAGLILKPYSYRVFTRIKSLKFNTCSI